MSKGKDKERAEKQRRQASKRLFPLFLPFLTNVYRYLPAA